MGQPTAISWPIAATGIATKTSPLMLQPGGQLVLDNVRQERKDEWRTRSGFTRSALDDVPGTAAPLMCVEMPTGGFFALGRGNTDQTAGLIYSPTSTPRWHRPPTGSGGYQSCSQLTPSIWSRQGIAPFQAQFTGAVGTNDGPTKTSSAEGDGYRLSAWWWGTVAGTQGIQVSLTATDGTAVFFAQKFNANDFYMRPCCVFMPSAHMLVLFWTNPVTGNVQCNRWDTTTGNNLGITNLAANCHGTAPFLDALYYGVGLTITYVYRDNVGTGGLRQGEYNPATNANAVFVPGVDASHCLALLPDPDASGTRLVGLTTAVPEVRVVRTTAAGVILTNHLADAVDGLQIAGCAYTGGVEWMIVYREFAAGLFRAVKRVGGVTSAAKDLCSAGALASSFQLASGGWREPNTDAMRYLMMSTGVAFDLQTTFYEMALEFNNGTNAVTNDWNEPQARLLPLNAGAGGYGTSCLPQVQRTGTDRFVTIAPRVTKINQAAGLGSRTYAIDAWAVQYMNDSVRYTQNVGDGARNQQCGFLPAGSLLQTATGLLPVAHGAGALPYAPTFVPSTGAGALSVTKRYQYVQTVELPDEEGNVWRSPPSNVLDYTLAGTENTMTLTLLNMPFENLARPRIVKLWRTLGNGSEFFLLNVWNDTILNTNTLVYVDLAADIILEGGEPISAELQATITPAFSHIASWNGRMFGIERDFPTRVWWSKPFSTGILPEFPGEFVTDTDDGLGPLTGLAALDDKLVLTKARSAYVGGGDGPDNEGNGAPFAFNRISSETGKIVGAPLVSTGREVYLVSDGGLFRIGGSQGIDFVGASIDRYLSMPLLESPETVTGMVVSSGHSEVRVQTTGYRFVHDRIFDIWIRDTGGMVALAGIAMTRMLGGSTQVMFTAAGQMWIEAADSATPNDAGNAFAGTIRHAWVRPNGVEGRIQLFRGRVLGECTASGTVQSPQLTIYFDNDDSIFETFFPAGSLTIAAGPIRAEGQPRRQRCDSFSMQLTLPQGDATWRLDAWSAAVHLIPAMQPLPLARRWRPGPTPVPAPPLDGMLFWFKADAGITMNGSNRVGLWSDQTANHYDVSNVTGLDAFKPLWTSDAQNGLPMLDWGKRIEFDSSNYKFLYRIITTPDPDPIKVVGARTHLAVIRPTTWLVDATKVGGIVVNEWGAAYTFDSEMLVYGGQQRAADDGGYFWQLNSVVDYANTPIIVAWEWPGPGSTYMNIYVNGVLRPGFYPGGNIIRTPAGGVLRLTIGMEYGNSYTSPVFNGMIGEVMGYAGVNPIATAAATAYLRAKWNL